VNHGTLYPVLLKLEQEGIDHLGVGCFGEQPEGQILPAVQGRQEGIAVGEAPVGADTEIVARFFAFEPETE